MAFVLCWLLLCLSASLPPCCSSAPPSRSFSPARHASPPCGFRDAGTYCGRELAAAYAADRGVAGAGALPVGLDADEFVFAERPLKKTQTQTDFCLFSRASRRAARLAPGFLSVL
jgi:hypothetical protein